MANAIPDRWLDYKPIGKKVEGTNFIAFKVPLKEDISKTVDRKIRLNSTILLKKIPNLGLVIDLTNTYRYYDPTDFQRAGVQYKKIMIPGREIPSKDLVDIFSMIVKQFLDDNKNNDKLIGVHCTHGVNRTGYFICNYMISQMRIEPKEALDRFADARGYKIERSNYIDDLHKLQESNARSSSTKHKFENWRERKEPVRYTHRNTKNEYVSPSSSRYVQRYTPTRTDYRRRYGDGERYKYSQNNRREQRFSNHRLSDQMVERTRNPIPPAARYEERLNNRNRPYSSSYYYNKTGR